MKITVASLTLRFYVQDGWTKDKIRKLLVNPKMKITFRDDTISNALLGCVNYYAVYEKSGHKVFKKSEMDKHKIIDSPHYGGEDWYINEEE